MRLTGAKRKKAIQILGCLQKTVLEFVAKGGPGSGPRPGHGHGGGYRVGSPPGGVSHTPAKIDISKLSNPAGKDTHEQHRDATGKLSPERQALHDQIVKHFMGTATPVAKPEAHILGGGPASGKSTALNSGHVVIPKNHVAIDADEIKKHLPEYGKMVAAGDHNAAPFVHEESSHISKRILAESAKAKYNIVLDGTGDGGLDNLAKKINTVKSAGHEVHGHYVTVDTATALARNKARAEKTGRLPPEDMVKQVHKAVSSIVPQAIHAGLFDHFNMFDTNGQGAKLIATAHGKTHQIHDQALWDRFLAKANE